MLLRRTVRLDCVGSSSLWPARPAPCPPQNSLASRIHDVVVTSGRVSHVQTRSSAAWEPSTVTEASTSSSTSTLYLGTEIDGEPPCVKAISTPFNDRVIASCPSLLLPYCTFPDCFGGGHLETLLGAFARSLPQIEYRREFLPTSDGGVIAVDWHVAQQDLPSNAPVLLLLSGLTGSSDSKYVRHATCNAAARGYRVAVCNHRGTGNSPVVSPQLYSASFTGDLRLAIRHAQSKFPAAPLLAAGWSIGGNVLVNYLGEVQAATPLKAAISLCNPFNLTVGDANWCQPGFCRIYDWHLAHRMRRVFQRNEAVLAKSSKPINVADARQAPTVRDFDSAYTIHTFGYASVDDYYQHASSCLRLPDVRIPLLCVQALDDPIAPKEAIPYDAFDENPNLILVTTPTGGHLGWVTGAPAPKDYPWTDDLMLEFFDAALQQLGVRSHQEQATLANVSDLVQEKVVTAAAASSA